MLNKPTNGPNTRRIIVTTKPPPPSTRPNGTPPGVYWSVFANGRAGIAILKYSTCSQVTCRRWGGWRRLGFRHHYFHLKMFKGHIWNVNIEEDCNGDPTQLDSQSIVQGSRFMTAKQRESSGKKRNKNTWWTDFHFADQEKKISDTTNLIMIHNTDSCAPNAVKASLCYFQHRAVMQKFELMGTSECLTKTPLKSLP